MGHYNFVLLDFLVEIGRQNSVVGIAHYLFSGSGLFSADSSGFGKLTTG